MRGPKQKSETNEMYVALNVRVDPPAGFKDSLQLKIYTGKSSNGEYELIYDQNAKAKVQIPRTLPSSPRARLLKLPDKLKNAPARIKKKFLEHRKKMIARMRIPKRRVEPDVFCARFDYKNDHFKISPGQDNLYFRTILYDSKGQVIKEGRPTRWCIPRSTYRAYKKHDPSIVRGYDSRPPSLNGHTIYPYFSRSHRALKFAFLEKDAFKIKSFSIDGIEYAPVFIGRTSKSTYKDRKTGTQKTYYSSSMSLKYPFGGQAKLKFKYKTATGKFKRETFSFYLPPPPPLIKAKADSDGNAITISWDKIEKGIDKSHFFTVPVLELQKNNRSFKTFPVYQQNSYSDRDVFRGEPVRYTMSYNKGLYKAVLWSSEKGVENYKLSYMGICNPILDKGINITVPTLSESKHPVRIELLESLLCYENTGIASCKLLKEVLNRLAKEKDIVVYDRKSRDYIIDEKYFALSDSLKKQLLIKESDYAVRIKDYSRQDGNGLELWLFKKKIEGTAGSKTTTYWRVADISIEDNEQSMIDAAEKLIAKIRETLEFRACVDTRKKNIKPKNIICSVLRPVNQKCVMVNYEAVCESLFLTLSEKSDIVQILSRSDWDEIFRERITRFDKGYSFINNAVREVLLTGRIWRNGKIKTYYIQACDAFSGEVLGCRIFSGKARNAASELAEWIKRFRLSDDIKVDFQISKFHQAVAKNMNFRPWSPRTDLIRNYGSSISNPQKSWAVRRKKKRPTVRSYKRSTKNAPKGTFYTFVRRQWKDGYRAKAVKLLEKDWKDFKDIKTGELLGEYYIELKRYQDAIDLFKNDWEKTKTLKLGALLSNYYIKARRYKNAIAVYDAMVQLDGCPKYVYDNYNSVKT